MKTVIEMAQEAGFETMLRKGRICGFDRDGDYTEEIEAFAELVRADALAEQPAQQEPVAWMSDVGSVASAHEKKMGYVLESAFTTPLYTSPPAQRTWVGLTDEEVTKMPAWIYSPDQDGMTAEEGLETFARVIEAKLKEKNT